MKTYNGACHCGSITFSFESKKIESGLRCNCSMCKRKGSVMSDFTIPPDKFKFTDKNLALAVYQFDTLVAHHYFCRYCGIYPFHETLKVPGNFRVNLGCIDELDTNQIRVDVFDGKNI